MSNKPILSIIIPTKDNVEIAFQTIKAVANLELDNVEIVVQDNGKTDHLRKSLLELINKKKVIYNYDDKNMPIIGNFNLSLSVSSGEYVCFIGDDDGIHPEILEAVKWAKENQIEVIVPKLKAVYYWPGSSKKYKQGHLQLSPFTGQITIHNSLEELIKLIEGGCLDYINYNLPKAYHGIVAREKMEEIFNITGNYFGGLVPDMYGVTALSLIIKEVVYIDFPLTIPGISPKSNSGKSVKNETNGTLEEAPQLKWRGEYLWSENIPRIFSDETIWADTLMHALDDMGRSDLKLHFNSEKLHVRLWFRYKNLRKQIEAHYGRKLQNDLKPHQNLFKYLKDSTKKVPIFVSIYMKYRCIVIEKNIKDIECAVSAINNSRCLPINFEIYEKRY